MPTPPSHRLRFGDFFAGGGGASIGAARTYDIVFGVDINEEALQVFAQNHPEAETFCEDIWRTEGWLHRLEHPSLRVDCAHFSAPCQAFSFASSKRGRDERSWLTVAAADLVLRWQAAPSLLVWENVSNVAHSTEWAVARGKLEAHGYEIIQAVVNLAYLGVPQHRRRLMALACKDGVTSNLIDAVRRGSLRLPRSIGQAFPGRHAFWHSSRSSHAPCVLPADMPHPTLRSAYAYHPRPGVYTPRLGDAAPLSTVAPFSVMDYKVIQGWPPHAHLPQRRRAAVKILANSVAPQMERFVLSTVCWPDGYMTRPRRSGLAATAWRHTRCGCVAVAAMRWWRAKHETELLRQRWSLWNRRIFKITFMRGWRPRCTMEQAWAVEAAARTAFDKRLLAEAATPAAQQRAREEMDLPAVASEAATALWTFTPDHGLLRTDDRRPGVALRGGMRMDAAICEADTVPEWAMAADGVVPLPSSPPAIAASAAAVMAARAWAAAGMAWALVTPLISNAARCLPRRDVPGRYTAGVTGAHAPAAGAAAAALAAARHAADLSIHAFIESGVAERYSHEYGEGADLLAAMEELSSTPGPWNLGAAATAIKERDRMRRETASRLIDALDGSPGERSMRRWLAAAGPRSPDADPDFDEVRLRLRAGLGVSGAAHNITGRVQEAWREWYKWTDDPEVRRWVRHGVDFNVCDPKPYNSALGTSGQLLPGCGNLPGALLHRDFVTQALEELILTGVVADLGAVSDPNTEVPLIVSPLNVVPKSSGKLRLCHDGRPTNQYIDPGTFRMETLARNRYIWTPAGRLTTMDLTSAYWTLKLVPRASRLTGFCWMGRYLVWLGLPFGINEACRIFQTIMNAIWRPMRCGRRACIPRPHPDSETPRAADRARRTPGLVGLTYIDDVVVTARTACEARWMTAYLLVTLMRTGWIVSWPKSNLIPRPVGIVLGVRVNLTDFTYNVTDKMRDKIVASADAVLLAADTGTKIPVRALASFCGKVMSTFLAVGDPAYIFTKKSYELLARAVHIPHASPRRSWIRAAWRATTRITPAAAQEAAYWRATIRAISGAPIAPRVIPARLVALAAADTSDTASGGFFIENGTAQLQLFRQWLRPTEVEASSTTRELLGIARLLRATAPGIKAPWVQVFCDSQCGFRALRRGSKTPAVHAAAQQVWTAAMLAGKTLLPAWLPRTTREITLCDELSKVVAGQDWQLDPAVFQLLATRYGQPSVDAFADEGNAQIPRFFSRFWVEGTAGVDAFAQDWRAEQLVYAYPPFECVGRVYRHVMMMEAKAIIVAPAGSAAPWATMLQPGSPGVVDATRIPPKAGLVRGRQGVDATPRDGLIAALVHGFRV